MQRSQSQTIALHEVEKGNKTEFRVNLPRFAVQALKLQGEDYITLQLRGDEIILTKQGD